MSSAANDITIEELLATLKRTSLPTIIVEGSDDLVVYRTLEGKLAHLGVSVLPVGGRGKVLDLFRRKNEIPTSIKPLFIADKDIWVNTGIPMEFLDSCFIFTSGYSIENDVYIDGELWKLVRESETANFKSELNDFIEWYALALSRHLSDSTQPISTHPNQVLDPAKRASLLSLKAGETYPFELLNHLKNDYPRLLRGKSLINTLLRSINKAGRNPQHKGNALMETVAIRPGALLSETFEKASAHFSLGST